VCVWSTDGKDGGAGARRCLSLSLCLLLGELAR